jgi:ferric-dicitrate binding protein FerR (iron transport regulator)
MILPDNTMVYLNSGSEIKYAVNNAGGQREVFLDGEAWFDVAKNEKKPFVVNTPFYAVKVLGTRFNVKAYKTDDEIATTLEEGSVEVLSSGSSRMNGKKILKPGQQFIYNQSTGTVRTEHVSTRLFTSWKDNKLIFINMNLEELIVLLERKYGVDIDVDDNIILDYHYDGTIKNETILEVLDLLKETLPIRYKIEGQKVIIQKR